MHELRLEKMQWLFENEAPEVHQDVHQHSFTVANFHSHVGHAGKGGRAR